MTNKEKYKQAFSVLHTSENFSLEVEKMALLKRKQRMNIAAAVAAVCILLIGGTGTAYAANVGGIQRTIQLWIRGDQTDAALEVNQDGSYRMSYQDENGTTVEQAGGGVAFEADGSERPLTEEEIMEEINAPEVKYEEDGSVWVYYYNQKMEITDKFDEDGVCYVKLSGAGETLYMTVKYQMGWATSTNSYISPKGFNCISPSEGD